MAPNETLLAYLKTRGAAQELARACSIDPKSVTNWRKNTARPTDAMKVKIHDATHGQVPVKSWFPPEYQ